MASAPKRRVVRRADVSMSLITELTRNGEPMNKATPLVFSRRIWEALRGRFNTRRVNTFAISRNNSTLPVSLARLAKPFGGSNN